MDTVREILEQIAAKHGGVLRPDDVVETARDPESPLHDKFEWDDAKAGHQHRLDEARSLIRSVRLIVTTTTARLSVPHFVHVPSAPTQGYVATVQVRSQREIAVQAICEEWTQIRARLERLRGMAAGLGLDLERARAERVLAELAPTVRVEAEGDGESAEATA